MNCIKSQFIAVCIACSLFACGGSSSPKIVTTNTGNTHEDIESMMSQANVPGVSIAVIKGFEIVEVHSVGVIDQSSQEEVTEQTRFQAASISKAITAVATMKWAGDTQTPIEKGINDILTSWQLPENGLTTSNVVTIEGILRHTAGINVSGFPGYNRNTQPPSLIQVLEGSGITNTDPIEVTTSPNSKWRYSGGGFTVLQQAIEDETEMSFQDFMDWQIIEFLGLNNSTFELESNIDSTTVSSGHLQGSSPVTGQFHVYPEKAAAGYWTNARDLARFGIQFQLALKGESQLLSEEQAKKMLTSTLSSKYAIGFELFESGYFGHSGSNEGFRSLIRLNSDGFGLVVLTNSDNGDQLMKPLIKYFNDKYEQ